MFLKHVTAGLTGAVLLATAALAQTPAATTDRWPRPADDALHPFRDETEHVGIRRGRKMMREHEDRDVTHRAGAAPTAVALVLLEGPAPHDDRPDVCDCVLQDGPVFV